MFAFATTGFIVFSVLSHSDNPEQKTHATIVNDSFETFILAIMTVICIWVNISQIS